MKFKQGQRVKYIDDNKRIFKIYAVYNKNYVSLGLYDYPDIEQDYKTNVNKIKAIK